MIDLPTTIAAADGLVDFRFANASLYKFKKSKDIRKIIFRMIVGRRIMAKIKPSKGICKERRVRGASSATDHIRQLQ